MNVKTVFFYDLIFKIIYMQQLKYFTEKHSEKIYKLCKIFYKFK